MKKFKKALLFGLMLGAYKVGKLAGHIGCLNNIASKYKKDIFERHGEIVDDNGWYTISIKPKKSEGE